MNQRSLWCLNLSGRATASNRTAPLESTGWIFHWLICVITMIWLAHIRHYQPKLLFEQCVSQSKLPTEKVIQKSKHKPKNTTIAKKMPEKSKKIPQKSKITTIMPQNSKYTTKFKKKYRFKTPDYIRLQHQPPWTISVYDCNSNHPGQLAYVIVRIGVKISTFHSKKSDFSAFYSQNSKSQVKNFNANSYRRIR